MELLEKKHLVRPGEWVGFKASRTWDGASLTSSSLQRAQKGVWKEKRLRLGFRLGRGTVHSAFKGEPLPSSLCDIEITVSSRSRHWPFPTHHQIMSREGLRLPPFCDFGFLKQAYQRKGGLGSKPRHRLGDNLNPSVYFLSETRWMWQKKGGDSGVLYGPWFFTLGRGWAQWVKMTGVQAWESALAPGHLYKKPITTASLTPGEGRKRGDGGTPVVCWPDLLRSGFNERFAIKQRAIEKDGPDWPRGLQTHVDPWADTRPPIRLQNLHNPAHFLRTQVGTLLVLCVFRVSKKK